MKKTLTMALATVTAGTIVQPMPVRAEPPDCLPIPGAGCGTIQVPLVRSQPELGSTTVAYTLLRHTDRARPARGTVALNPGGPGASAIAMAPVYARVHADLLTDHDLLLVDPRGVNRSGPLTCAPGVRPATRQELIRAAEACGQALGPRSRAYTSAETVDDIDAVRARLRIPKLVLKGESYGTYLMTVYAQRHPNSISSIVLSSAYSLAFDPFARPNARALRRAIRLMCDSSAGRCSADRVLADLSRLSDRLHRRPIPYLAYGQPRVLDDTALSATVYHAAASAPRGLGDVPAAVRAALRGDPGELIALALHEPPMSGSTAPAAEQDFNDGLNLTVVCNDYPTAWNRRAPAKARLRQFAAARAALPEALYTPFGKRAFTSTPEDRGNTCIRWPDRHNPPQHTTGPFADVPVLVVSGALDPNTPTEEGRQAARQFRHATVVEAPNLGHVPEGEPSGCVARIQTTFIRTGQPGDTTCLTSIPPVPVRP